MKPILSIVVAAGLTPKGFAIGFNNRLPWHVPEDLQRFKKITWGHHLIVGRKTFESIGKPLPNRVSVIVSRDKEYTVKEEYRPLCVVVNSIEAAFDFCREQERIFVIGGAQIYAQTIDFCDRIYLTEITYGKLVPSLIDVFESDALFPAIGDEWEIEKKEGKKRGKIKKKYGDLHYQFVTYKRK